MGKVGFFSILLQKQYPFFFSGEPVVGTVNIRVNERLKYNSVSMVLAGRAKVHW